MANDINVKNIAFQFKININNFSFVLQLFGS